ncbi:MAG TPA: 2OG-Fe(II) oxygenase [Rudaea sp.]|jgi:hypothetical protein
MIRPDVLSRVTTLAASFGSNRPFRHVVIDDFLDAGTCRRMLADFPHFEDRYALNEMGEVGGKAVRMNVREISDTYRDLDQYLQTREFLDFVSVVTGIPDLLYDPEYIGGGTHENRDGQGLDQHVDFNFHPGTRWHRRLNLIVYLNPEWGETWGGNLQLQADPWNGDASGPSVAPMFNRAVIFETTERSWHGFSNIQLPADKKDLSRKSFAIYLYTKERPPQETAASHATVYVPEGMPVDLVPGVTLDAVRVGDLRGRFERMFGQLKFLYEREKQFAGQIAAMEGALAQARNALRLPLQGYAEQAAAPQGMWLDRWVGKEFSATFTPQRKARGVELELWVPEQLTSDQVLEIEIHAKRWTHHVARGSRSQFRLDMKLPTGDVVELKIRAGCSFSPAAIGQSADDRELAWMLLGIALSH